LNFMRPRRSSTACDDQRGSHNERAP
jgi:hypothetical protein